MRIHKVIIENSTRRSRGFVKVILAILVLLSGSKLCCSLGSFLMIINRSTTFGKLRTLTDNTIILYKGAIYMVKIVKSRSTCRLGRKRGTVCIQLYSSNLTGPEVCLNFWPTRLVQQKGLHVYGTIVIGPSYKT